VIETEENGSLPGLKHRAEDNIKMNHKQDDRLWRELIAFSHKVL
jgi:hypothetical protein